MVKKPKTIVPVVQPQSEVIEVNPSEQANLVKVCEDVGATQEHLIRTLYAATLADKSVYDKLGNLVSEEPDHDKRIKGAMSLLEIRGDVKNKFAVQDNRKYTQVNYTWGEA